MMLTQKLNKQHILGLFLELLRAFDTADHSILLFKLQHYGIKGICLDLLKSYFSNRQQYTVIDKAMSDTLPCGIGVPQGSILGPPLLLYASMILKIVPKSPVLNHTLMIVIFLLPVQM